MNSQSDRRLSNEELKALNRPPQVEILLLLNGLLQRQQRIEETLTTLTTKEDMETILSRTASLNNCIQALQKQVGKMSENNTTSIENMERASRKSVRSLAHTAKVSIILTALISLISTILLALLQLLL